MGNPKPRVKGSPANIPSPTAFPISRQRSEIGPKFDRLRTILERDGSGLELRSDPSALAAERLLVFEVRGAINAFANAVRKVPGLDLIDEEDFVDGETEKPVAYLLVPDLSALREIESLWRRWISGQTMRTGFTPWRDVFATLRDLRPWGPDDRISEPERKVLLEEIMYLSDDELVTLEIELVFRSDEAKSLNARSGLTEAISAEGGNVLSEAKIGDIAYHAVLCELPVRAIRGIIENADGGLSWFDPIQHIRPQSLATSTEIGDTTTLQDVESVAPLGEPILALIDGVPIARHPLLANHLIVEDAFDLEPNATLSNRSHGTAMASLIIHGDRNNTETPLPRMIHTIPVLGDRDRFPVNRLIVDLIYQAVITMRSGQEPSASHVLIINLSLGNRHRPFHGILSPWARLLDRLAYRFGILFLVSAGNVTDTIQIPDFSSSATFEDADGGTRSTATISALDQVKAERRIISPAETVNGLTIGAANTDWVDTLDRRLSGYNIDPFPFLRTSNPSSALGPGFANSVKPEIILPGGREALNVVGSGASLTVRPVSAASRAAGLKVAAPPVQGIERAEGYTNGTSAATALAARTAHRIHDALEAEYGDEFLSLSSRERAVLLKALLVHPASWPEETALKIKQVVGPLDNRQHVRQKDNIRRYLGYGTFDLDTAVACASDRATFWAVGEVNEDQTVPVAVPIPASYGGKAQFHSLSATLAWFTPVNPGRKGYRSVRLKILEPGDLGTLALSPGKIQPDQNQSSRGTISTRIWNGDKSAAVGSADEFIFEVQRPPDTGGRIDGGATFALAVSIQMPGVLEIYDEVRLRLRPAVRANG